jgi:hypothetical protein
MAARGTQAAAGHAGDRVSHRELLRLPSWRLNKLSLSDNRSTRSGRSVESSLTDFTAGFLNLLLMRKACSEATWKGSTSGSAVDRPGIRACGLIGGRVGED